MNLSPLPIQKFFSNNGRPLAGGLLFTYEAGTSTPQVTYTDASGMTPNSNPIVLDFRGEAEIWLDIDLTYKFILAPEGDTDPPTRPIWTVDDIAAPVTMRDLTQQIIGRILWPRTPAEISAGITPVNYAEEESTPERYQDNSDPGITVMDVGFSSALLVNQAGGQRVLCKMTTYKLNTGLVVDPYRNDVDLAGATLDFSGLSSGYAVSLVSDTPAASPNVNAMISRTFRNGYIKGGDVSGVRFLNTGSPDVANANYFFGFDCLGVYNFQSGIWLGSQSFMTTFRHMVMQCSPGSSGYMVNIVGGGVNYGERFGFFDCGFPNCDGIVDAEYGNVDMFFINCSFDYCTGPMFKLRSGATVYCDNCHFESNTDTQVWFDVDDANSLLQISGSQLLITGSRSSYPLGTSGSSVGMGGIELLDCKLGIGPGVAYSQDYVIAGTGRVVVRNLKQYGTPGDYVVPSFFNNTVWNYNFASATLTEYNLGGASPPARDTTTGHGDSNSLKFNPGAGQDSSTWVARLCQPGEIPTFGFYWKATGVGVGQQVDVTILYYDQDKNFDRDTSIATGGSAVLSTSPASFTRFRLQAQAPAPPGTRIALFLVNVPAGNARTLWIDDVFASYS